MPHRSLQNKEVTRIVAASLPSLAKRLLESEESKALMIKRLRETPLKELRPLLLEMLSGDKTIDHTLIEIGDNSSCALIAQSLLLQCFTLQAVDYLKQHAADELRRGQLSDDSLQVLSGIATNVMPRSGNTTGDMVMQTALFTSLYAIAGMALSSSDSIAKIMHNESVAINSAALATTLVTLAAVGFVAGSIATGGLLPLGMAGAALTISGTLAAGAIATHLVKQGGLMLETAMDDATCSSYSAQFKLNDAQLLTLEPDKTKHAAIETLVRNLAMAHDSSLDDRTVFEWATASETLISTRCKELIRQLVDGDKSALGKANRFLDTQDIKRLLDSPEVIETATRTAEPPKTPSDQDGADDVSAIKPT